MNLQTTCWRALRLEHPPEWELALACGPEDTQRVILADRRFHRLDLRWRTLKYVPNLELMLTRHKQPKKDVDIKVAKLATAPAAWRGLVQKTPDGTVTHAGRYFRNERLLAEATLVWPNSRDVGLESSILDSIRPVDTAAMVRPWQAMGLNLQCPSKFDLVETNLEVGKVQWHFRPVLPAGKTKTPKHAPLLEISRIALPSYWLGTRPLREWLRDQLPEQFDELRVRSEQQGPHATDIIVSSSRGNLASRLSGKRQLRMDVAWLCQAENRVYHVNYSEQTTGDEANLPDGWAVKCCQHAPAVMQGLGVS